MFSARTSWNRTTNRLSEALACHRSSGKPLLDLSVSNPTECGFYYDNHAIMRALCSPASLQYHPDPRGLPIARLGVVQYYAERDQQVSIDDIVLTTSTSEAYSFVFRLLCNAGDEVLVPSPSYPLFDFLADIQDVKIRPYPLVYDHGWQIDLHGLEQAITPRTRGIIVVHPNNPTGSFVKLDELAALNHLCAEKQMALIADEVFLDFSLRHDHHASFSINAGALTFTMSGLSKIVGLPQMKLAWLVASGPEQAKREALARLEIIADTYLSMNAPVQLASPAFLLQRHSFQKQLIARVRANLEELDRQITRQKHCGRLKIEGGWYAVLRIPATRSDEELALALLEQQGVYVHPGHFYDFAQEGYLVVSLITQEPAFAEGIQRLLAFFS
ncbi:MAG TPA: pyridoxal phosphate-dependent aminotransferase [Candidatus Angelobacter sp.]|jgi:aspartate/methionine/tyrosine aminotransferase|nr:pyridoxal phosphate-dependent aminotransferase [Candidatus Angelobacter sp.]